MYQAYAFLSVLVFSLVHLMSWRASKMGFIAQGRFLSFGGGVAISYVFIDLLPKLCKKNQVVSEALSGLFPFFERHVYIMALAGFLLFFTIDRTSKFLKGRQQLWLSIISYALFNFFVGYAVVDKNNPEVRPLLLFTVAVGLHYFTNDYFFSKAHQPEYQSFGKWILIFSLFFGWTVGLVFVLPQTAVALISAFIGGGVIMNVIRHEMPEDNPNSLPSFLIAAFLYTGILKFDGSY